LFEGGLGRSFGGREKPKPTGRGVDKRFIPKWGGALLGLTQGSKMEKNRKRALPVRLKPNVGKKKACLSERGGKRKGGKIWK